LAVFLTSAPIGGFLGMGEREVAVEFKSLRFAERMS
jgi:hypothetical protein